MTTITTITNATTNTTLAQHHTTTAHTTTWTQHVLAHATSHKIATSTTTHYRTDHQHRNLDLHQIRPKNYYLMIITTIITTTITITTTNVATQFQATTTQFTTTTK